MKKSIFILTFLLVSSLASIIFLSSNRLTYQSKAAPSCHPLCQTEPSCCAEILRRLEEVGDDIYDLPDAEQPYHACEWDAGNADTNYRGYCKPSTCNQLPEGIK
ncbi:hypothetical protein HYT02_04245, partial [Candidatus Gottesmanbacteria bacterium]|nr:hypothetical protein [Candidatus Gottesmanbacteria bacterium]